MHVHCAAGATGCDVLSLSASRFADKLQGASDIGGDLDMLTVPPEVKYVARLGSQEFVFVFGDC